MASTKNILTFFIHVSKLKRIKRTGWVWLGKKNVETVAEHSFRTAFFAWILGAKSGLNVKRMVETALIHDICEVYAGDLTPYYGILPKDSRQRKKILARWIRAPQQEKEKLSKERFLIEQKALKKLVAPLQKHTQREIIALWMDFEKGNSVEGRFVKQCDKVEALLQAIEYFGTGPNTPVVGWWEEVEETVDHPVLKEFTQTIHNVLYKKKKGTMATELDFLTLIGVLKRKPREGWVLRGVKQPESIAEHGFMFALMAWTFTKELSFSINMHKVLKLALAHVLPTASIQEHTPYDAMLREAKTKQEKQKILQQWVRYASGSDRKRISRQNYKEEKKALKDVISRLRAPLRQDLLHEWEELQENRTREAQFVNQVYIVDALLQALQYWEQNKRFPIKPWWEWAFESSHSQLNIEFMEELKKRFSQDLSLQ